MILTQIISELLLKSTVHRFLLVLANTGTSDDYLINFRSLKKQACTFWWVEFYCLIIPPLKTN